MDIMLYAHRVTEGRPWMSSCTSIEKLVNVYILIVLRPYINCHMLFVHTETDGRLRMSSDTSIEKLVNVH